MSLKLSIIIPIYNEKDTLLAVINNVNSLILPRNMTKELILVDDYSTDGSREILKSLEHEHQVIYQPKNRGKGAAVRAGFAAATGDYIVIQDADLECNPEDINLLLEEAFKGYDIVYGNRFNDKNPPRVRYIHAGLMSINLLSRLLTRVRLHDIYCCYKLFSKSALDRIRPVLISDGFTIEAELTARAVGYKICEVPIKYAPRLYAEGKKIRIKDGLKGLWAVFYFNVLYRPRMIPKHE